MDRFAIVAALGLLVGCGDDGVHHLADGPPLIDATVDASIDAMPQPITVRYYATPGVPGANFPVTFTEAGGASHVVMTDASGAAAIVAGPNTTAVAIDDTNANVYAFEGLSPGDVVTAGFPQANIPGLGFITVSYATYPGAASYQVEASCLGSDASIDANTTQIGVAACADAAAAAITVIPLDASQARLGASSMLANQDLASLVNTTVTMPAFTASTVTTTGTFTHVEDGASVGFETDYNNRADDPQFLDSVVLSATATGTGPIALAARLEPVGAFTRFELDYQTTSTRVSYLLGSSGRATTFDVDLANRMASPTNATYDSVANAVAWTGSSGAAPQVLIVSSSVTATVSYSLYLYGPGGGTSLPMPPLPADHVPTSMAFGTLSAWRVDGMTSGALVQALSAGDPRVTLATAGVWTASTSIQ